MAQTEKPGWHARGYLPHFDANGVLQHIILSGVPHVNLASNELGQLIEEALLYHDGTKYDLQAWCIMPDHLHLSLVIHPDHLMSKVIWTWKKWIVTQAQKLTPPIQRVFALDYFDRYVRTLKQAQRLPGYIEYNAVKGGLVANAADWRWSSAWHRARGWCARSENLPVFLPKWSR